MAESSSSGSIHYFKDGSSSGNGGSNYSSSSICDNKQLSHPRPFDPGPSLPQALLWQIAASILLPLHMHVIAKGLAAAVGALDPPNEAFSGPERIIFDPRSAAAATDAAHSAYANTMATRGCAAAGTVCPGDLDVADGNFNSTNAADPVCGALIKGLGGDAFRSNMEVVVRIVACA